MNRRLWFLPTRTKLPHVSYETVMPATTHELLQLELGSVCIKPVSTVGRGVNANVLRLFYRGAAYKVPGIDCSRLRRAPVRGSRHFALPASRPGG